MLSALVITCYVVCIGGVYAPWLRLGIEVATPTSSARTFWDNGTSVWGSGNSVVVLAVIGIGVSGWCFLHTNSRLRNAVPSLFIALLVIAARQCLAYGQTPSGWRWSSVTREVGWGLTLILVASAVGTVASMRWLFVGRPSGEVVSGRNDLEPNEVVTPVRSVNYLRALLILTLFEIAFSHTTWIDISEDVGRTVRLTYRGDSNYGVGFITIVLGLVLLLMCVAHLRKPGRQSPVAPSALVIANLVVLANYYVAYARPPSFHEFTHFRVQWGFFVALGASLLSALVLVGWWRVERARTRTTTGPPRPPSE